MNGAMKDVLSPQKVSEKKLNHQSLQSLHDHIQKLYQHYDKQQKQLLHLTHDPDKVESFAMIEHLTNQSAETADALTQSMQQYRDNSVASEQALQSTQQDMEASKAKLSRLNLQLSDIDSQIRSRLEVAATRDRMLQLSQERNIYKKKVIYVLLAIIIALTTAILASYSFFSKK